MTPAQRRILAEVRRAGQAGRTYNWRQAAAINALEAAGLVTVDRDTNLGPLRLVVRAVS